MTDDEILSRLRSARGHLSPVGLARLLGTLRGEAPSDAVFITYFKRAFPDIPLRTLRDCGAWAPLSGCSMTDADFSQALEPWLGSRHDDGVLERDEDAG